MVPLIVLPKFEVRSFTRPFCGNSDWVFGWSCKPQSWERGGGAVRGREWYPGKSVGDLLYCRFCAPAHLFSHPTSSVRKIFDVLLGVDTWPLGCEERMCCAKWPWNKFQRFPTAVVLTHQHARTDRQRDGRHAIAILRFALVFTARCTLERGIGIACRLSVRPSVCPYVCLSVCLWRWWIV